MSDTLLLKMTGISKHFPGMQALGLQDYIASFGFDALPEALASVRDSGLAGTIE